MNEKQIAFAVPEWVKPIKDNAVAGAIVGLMFSWAWDGNAKDISNLREYISTRFDNLNEAQVEEVASQLIKHGVIESKE